MIYDSEYEERDMVGTPLVHIGKLPSVNQWHGATGGRGRPHIYEKKEYKDGKRDMALQFAGAWRQKPIASYVDMYLTVSLWKVRDTDGCIKAIQDSLENAAVIEDDKFIRNLIISREYHPKGEEDSAYIIFTEVPEKEWPE